MKNRKKKDGRCNLRQEILVLIIQISGNNRDRPSWVRKYGANVMIKAIVRDVFFLSQKSEPATKEDAFVIQDLLDTLEANRDRCVGMAANMIGVKKNIIVINIGMINMAMVNARIIKKSQPYETEEGCLSLDGVRKTTRYRNIEVEYLDRNFKKQKQMYSGWIAQIIQHELDHVAGVII